MGRMVHHCETAEEFLRAAKAREARREARAAAMLAPDGLSRGEAEIGVRAILAEIDALELADRLEAAHGRAVAAVAHAAVHCAGGRMQALAQLRLCETLELLGRYSFAAEGFVDLEQSLPEEWPDIRMWCSNHLISVGVHVCNRPLQELGITRGAAVRSRVSDPDQVASYLQWRGIAESRRYQPDRAEKTFEESFPLRDRTVRRDVTKGFLLADIAYSNREDERGDELLAATVRDAERLGLTRHSRAGRRHLERFNPSVR
ncbi:MAG TPA: hypothetical protein VGO83_15385 [Thermoleophilaceae bacterium]|nr:hypothetical protein [Thermoleophilaceae bacterium]